MTQHESPLGLMAGEYRLLSKIGEGGCGAVYAAEHPLLKRRAAVKVLHRAPSVGSSSLARFVAEAQVVNQIRSRHIVDVFSFGELADGRPFYVMDLLDGEPLDRYLARHGRLGVAAALQILRPICQALELAHAAGIVHRDVKPQNIFLACTSDAETVPKLLDFGIAKLTHDAGALTVSGAVLGTPLYMSPEQACGAEIDARADVYAIGVLLYELLTGRVPLQADSALGLAMAHLTLTPSSPSSLRPDLPEQLDLPILRMLAKDRDERPASASEAFAALADAAARAGIELPATLLTLPPPMPLNVVRPLLATTVDEASAVGHAGMLQLAQPPRLERAQTSMRTRLVVFTSLLVALALFAALWRELSQRDTNRALRVGSPVTSSQRAVRDAKASSEPRPVRTEVHAAAPIEPSDVPRPDPPRQRKRKVRTEPVVPRDLENPF